MKRIVVLSALGFALLGLPGWHAAHAAAPAAAVKHRVAAATDASVNRGHT